MKEKKMEKKETKKKIQQRKGALTVWNFPSELRKQMRVFSAAHEIPIQDIVKKGVEMFMKGK